MSADSETAGIMLREQMRSDAIRFEDMILHAVAHAEEMLRGLESQRSRHVDAARDKARLVLECAGLVEEAWRMASCLRRIGAVSEGTVHTRATELGMKIGSVASRIEIFLGEDRAPRYVWT
jgi:hypothetical protein